MGRRREDVLSQKTGLRARRSTQHVRRDNDRIRPRETDGRAAVVGSVTLID
jgi:hypothetical protein